MAPPTDAMFVSVQAQYPSLSTLGDMMYAFAQDNGYNFSNTLGYEFYAATGATGTTRGDLANSYWNDPDFAVSNLEQEDGTDLLLEDGSFVLMEAGNG
jgi:hypothetical protein